MLNKNTDWYLSKIGPKPTTDNKEQIKLIDEALRGIIQFQFMDKYDSTLAGNCLMNLNSLKQYYEERRT